MSESYSPKHDKEHIPANAHEYNRRQQEILNEAKKEAARARNEHAQKIEHLRDLVGQEAVESKEHASHEKTAQNEPEEANTYWYSREYRELAFKQLMGRVRTHMNKSDRALSKLVHRPGIERASEIGEKTVARTSGVLFGSIFSFVTSLATYYISRKNGYDMTYSIFIVSFIGGFFLGLLTELVLKTFRSLLSRR